MSGYPQGHYDEGYGQHPQQTDSYYQDEYNQQGHHDQHYDQAHGYSNQQQHHAGGDGYYDES